MPGDLVSPVAGALLRRGCPVVEVVTGATATVVWIAPTPNAKGAYKAQTYTVEEDGECGTSAAASHFALDLTDPAGMDRAARWLAAHHGLTVGATAPRWYCDNDGGRRATRYTLEGDGRTWLTFYDPANTLDTFGTGGRPIPRLPTDPAPAMALACLAAVGRSA